MREEKVYVTVVEQTPSADKQTRAQSIQGRMSMGMVHFPNFEPWFEAAHTELMKFPHGRHDDFVDALAPIGLGLSRILKASGERAPKVAPPAVGRSEERRVGKEGVRTCRSRGSPEHKKKQ